MKTPNIDHCRNASNFKALKALRKNTGPQGRILKEVEIEHPHYSTAVVVWMPKTATCQVCLEPAKKDQLWRNGF